VALRSLPKRLDDSVESLRDLRVQIDELDRHASAQGIAAELDSHDPAGDQERLAGVRDDHFDIELAADRQRAICEREDPTGRKVLQQLILEGATARESQPD
jgi:hypothetical protein